MAAAKNHCCGDVPPLFLNASYAGMGFLLIVLATIMAMLGWAGLLITGFFVFVGKVHFVILHDFFNVAIFYWAIVALKVNNQPMC